MRASVAAAFFCLFWICGQAVAQPGAAPAAPSSVAGDIDCTAYSLSGPQTQDDLARAKLCEEISRLKLELDDLRYNAPLIFLNQYIVPIVSAVAGAVITLLAFGFQGSFSRAQTQKLQQDRLASLMQGIGSGNTPEQFGAVSALLSRAEEIRGRRDTTSRREFRMLAQILVTVMRAGQLEQPITKYMAEGIVGVFGLRGLKSDNKLDPSMNLKTYGLSNAQLVDVDWKNVYAAGVEFFKANLTKTSLRSAKLTGAIFYEADLTNVVLKGADICGANFTNAKGMETVAFDASTQWDDKTVWPAGFTPPVRG